MWIYAFVLVGYFVSFSDNRVLMWITLGACGTYSFIYLAGQFEKNSNTFRSRLGQSLLLEHDMKGSAFRRSSLDELDEVSSINMPESNKLNTQLVSMEDLKILLHKLSF